LAATPSVRTALHVTAAKPSPRASASRRPGDPHSSPGPLFAGGALRICEREQASQARRRRPGWRVVLAGSESGKSGAAAASCASKRHRASKSSHQRRHQQQQSSSRMKSRTHSSSSRPEPTQRQSRSTRSSGGAAAARSAAASVATAKRRNPGSREEQRSGTDRRRRGGGPALSVEVGAGLAVRLMRSIAGGPALPWRSARACRSGWPEGQPAGSGRRAEPQASPRCALSGRLRAAARRRIDFRAGTADRAWRRGRRWPRPEARARWSRTSGATPRSAIGGKIGVGAAVSAGRASAASASRGRRSRLYSPEAARRKPGWRRR
jgi:hypothetical protein